MSPKTIKGIPLSPGHILFLGPAVKKSSQIPCLFNNFANAGALTWGHPAPLPQLGAFLPLTPARLYRSHMALWGRAGRLLSFLCPAEEAAFQRRLTSQLSASPGRSVGRVLSVTVIRHVHLSLCSFQWGQYRWAQD